MKAVSRRKLSGQVPLRRATTASAACVLEGPIEPVQLVAKLAKPNLFRSQLLFALYFSRLQLLFLAFQRFESGLQLGQQTLLNLLSLGVSILCAIYGIVELLNISGHVLPLILNSCEPIPHVIETLRSSRDCCLLALQPVNQNLCSLPGDRRCLQILPQLAYF